MQALNFVGGWLGMLGGVLSGSLIGLFLREKIGWAATDLIDAGSRGLGMSHFLVSAF